MDCQSTVIINTTTNSHDMMPWRDLNFISARECGTLLTINEKTYILTCFHGVKNAHTITIRSFEKKFNKKISHYQITKIVLPTTAKQHHLPEFDLTLIELDKIYKTALNLDMFDNIYPTVGEDLRLIMYDTKRIDQKIQIDRKEKICKVIKIDYDNLSSYHRTKIPYIYLSSESIIKEYPDLGGISGSLIINKKNKIIGIVSNIQQPENLLMIIPSYNCYRLIQEIISRGQTDGICSIVGKSGPIIGNKNYKSGHMIIKSYGVNYGSALNGIKDNDIITKIDNLDVNNFGQVFDSNCNSHIRLPAYIALNYITNSVINLEIQRSINGSIWSQLKIPITLRPINSTTYLPDIFNGKYYEIQGLIFVELSEDLIDYLEDININLIGVVEKYRKYSPYRNHNQKAIALIDINKNHMTKAEYELVTKHGLPYRRVLRRDFNIAIVTRIGTKKISTLDIMRETFEKICAEENKCNIYVVLSEFIKMNIVLENKQIEAIKLYGKKSRNKI
jgi:hypothetical protein